MGHHFGFAESFAPNRHQTIGPYLLPLLLTGRTHCGVGTWPADMVYLKTVKACQPIVLFLLPFVDCCITQSDFSISLERDGHSNVHISTVSFPQGLTGFSHCCQAHISGENILHPSLVGQCGLNVFAIVTQWYITDQFDGLHLYTISPKYVLEWEVHLLQINACEQQLDEGVHSFGIHVSKTANSLGSLRGLGPIE